MKKHRISLGRLAILGFAAIGMFVTCRAVYARTTDFFWEWFGFMVAAGVVTGLTVLCGRNSVANPETGLGTMTGLFLSAAFVTMGLALVDLLDWNLLFRKSALFLYGAGTVGYIRIQWEVMAVRLELQLDAAIARQKKRRMRML